MSNSLYITYYIVPNNGSGKVTETVGATNSCNAHGKQSYSMSTSLNITYYIVPNEGSGMVTETVEATKSC